LEKLAMVTTRQRLSWYVPGLPAEYHAGLWGQSYASIEAAIAALASTLLPGATVAVIPEGPYVLAKAQEHEMAIG
jgi:lactate racemase